MVTGTRFDEVEKIWRGPTTDFVFNPKESLGRILMDSMSRCPDFVGQVCHDDGSVMKNWEILRNATRVALNLKDLGMKEGEIIGIAAKNSKFLSSVVIGAFVLGTPINTIDPTFEKDDIAHMFGITRPKIVFCDSENFEDVRKGLKEIQWEVPIYLFHEGRCPEGANTVLEVLKEHPGEKSFVPPEISDASLLPATIICSSGTTGPSKGVSLSHATYSSQLQTFCILGEEFGTFFCFSSLYWLSGMITLIKTTAHNLTRVITVKPFSPALLLEIVERHKVNFLLTPPLQLAVTLRSREIAKTNLNSVEKWLCGGGHVPEENCREMNKILKNGTITIGYGCSEIGGLCSLTSDTWDSVGALAEGVELKIIDDNGQNMGVGERGEICIKTKYPMTGYFNNENATKESLIDGWFHTGDLGFFDAKGDLRIVDRKKEILKVGNYQINPSELEDVIRKIPEVVLVSVFGLPDPVFMDIPAAMIVKKENSSLNEGQVQEFVDKHLPSYKRLKGGVYFVDRMPVTPSGKIMKRKCRELIINKGM